MAQTLIFRELRPFELSHIRNFLHNGVCILYNQLLPQFSMDVSQTLQTYGGHIEIVHVFYF